MMRVDLEKAEIYNVREVSRRSVIAGLFITTTAGKASAAIGGASDRVDPHEHVEKAAEYLTDAMRALHGRDCWVHVDHDSGVAAVSLVFSKVSATPSA